MNDQELNKAIEKVTKHFEEQIKELQKQIDDLKRTIAKNNVAIGDLEEKVSKS